MTTSTYAILDPNGRCINRVVWNGGGGWSPPKGHTAVRDDEGLYPIYDDRPPQPRWVDFSTAVMTSPSHNAMLAAVLQTAPGLYAGMTIGLQQASEGDSRVFTASWSNAVTLGLIDAALISETQTMATDHDLPQDFVDSLAA